MAKLTIKQIQEAALNLVKSQPGGIRHSRLVHTISAEHPETPKNTIVGAVLALIAKHPGEVSKPSRGLYVPLVAQDNSPPLVTIIPVKVREEDFYQPFAEWLRNELDEATVAISLGGAGMQKKWGTPDVVGVYKPLASHRIKFDVELISAEIKVDPQQPVVAFGQAAAYRLFSAKSFKAIPEEPDFQIRERAQRYSPDMFYVNEFAERVYQLDVEMFNTLFG